MSQVRTPPYPPRRNHGHVLHSQLLVQRDVAPCMAALQLNSIPVITWSRPFILVSILRYVRLYIKVNVHNVLNVCISVCMNVCLLKISDDTSLVILFVVLVVFSGFTYFWFAMNKNAAPTVWVFNHLCFFDELLDTFLIFKHCNLGNLLVFLTCSTSRI